MDPQDARKLNRLFGIASYRSIEQDPAFGIRQTVDIALKALSPGINDPTTAKTCIDYLGTILQALADRELPSPFRFSDGKPRVIAYGPTFKSLVDQMFLEIRQNSTTSVSVIIRMLDILEKAASATSPSRRQILGHHALMIVSQAEKNITYTPALNVVRAHFQKAAEALHQIVPTPTQAQLFPEEAA